MYQIIAPTLFQNKICRLPGIGTLVMVQHPAETDFVHSHIESPRETIDFIAADFNEKSFNEFSAISELLQKNLDENGSFLLQGIGNFTKNENGEIHFKPMPVDPVLTPAIYAERIPRHEHATHTMLVGDQETTNVEMTEYYSEKPHLKDQWWIWAILLGAVGTGILIYYYSRFGTNGFGNVNY